MRKIIFIFVFGLLSLSGFIGQLILKPNKMIGETIKAEKPHIEIKGFLNGTYQFALENYVTDNLRIREYLIPVRNEITYSVLKSSPHVNVVIGKDNDLHGEGYIETETQIYDPMSKEDVSKLVEKLVQINKKLVKKGKSLFIFINPSKADVYPENIPEKYLFIAPKQKTDSSYKLFVEALRKEKLFYYDSIPYAKELKQKSEIRVFTKSGMHWSNVAAALCGKKLAESVEEQLKINLPEIQIAYERCEEPVTSDADLYGLLNLIKKPKDIFYKSLINISKSGDDSYSALARGGSFMGLSLRTLIQEGVFQNSCYLENAYILNEAGDLELFDSYDGLPIRDMLDNSDIVFLEVNEEAISRMSFGFIDYLLENNILE